MAAINLKTASRTAPVMMPGHKACGGCGLPIIVKQIFSQVEDPVVVSVATGCLEIISSGYPTSAWNVPFIHSAFENAAATISGTEAAYKALQRKGRLPVKDKPIKFAAMAGDGGTYDIGLQALSGALERGHNFVYICFDNEAYMNTGGQRSGGTPMFSSTTTAPAGKVKPGKLQFKKDLTLICAMHHIPYAAQASPSKWRDMMGKARKAFDADGPAFLNTLSVCPTGWKSDPKLGMEITQNAVDSCMFPLYEVEKGMIKLTYKPREKMPVVEYMKTMGRFRHMLKPGKEEQVEQLQQLVDERWEYLLKMDAITREEEKARKQAEKEARLTAED
jgi:pyruvate ferredoxin oxidoreductase beta subunit